MRRLCLLGLACALALSACGGGGDDAADAGPSKADVATAFKAQRATLQSIGADIETAVGEADQKTDAALAEEFGALADRADAARAGLDQLEPTAGTRPEVEALRRAVGTGARDLRRIAQAARASDADAAAAATKALITSGQAIGTRIDALAKELGLPATASAPSGQPANGKITVRYAQPANRTEALARDVLSAGGTDGVAAGFTKSFALPRDLRIEVVNGTVAPNYQPERGVITLSYGFVDQIARVLRRGLPGITESQLGEQLASIDGFILVHEMGHAFVDLFDLPITGREEDAVDQLATVFLVDAVDGGDEYAFYAARFFKLLAESGGQLSQDDFWDEHSLDVQRAYDIVCTIAGSSEARFKDIAKLGILGERRLQRCPQEYQQKTKAWKALLAPHTR